MFLYPCTLSPLPLLQCAPVAIICSHHLLEGRDTPTFFPPFRKRRNGGHICKVDFGFFYIKIAPKEPLLCNLDSLLVPYLSDKCSSTATFKKGVVSTLHESKITYRAVTRTISVFFGVEVVGKKPHVDQFYSHCEALILPISSKCFPIPWL